MSDTSLPKPLSAYVGLLVASVEEARAAGHSAAGQVARLPLAAAGQLLTARSRYDELAQTGELVVDAVVGLVKQRFGGGQEESPGWAGDDFGSARGKAGAAVALTTDVAEQVAGKLGGVAGKAASTVTSFAGSRTQQANDAFTEKVVAPVTETLEDMAERFEAEAEALAAQNAPEVTVTEPEADELDFEPEAAAEPTPMQQIESFSVPAEIGEQAGGLKSAADLPLADFDHMSGPQLRGRLRTLDRVQLVQLLDYERAHAHRVGIVLMLENRLAKLIADGGPTA